MQQMFSVKSAGERYGIGRNRIYTAIQTGELPAYRPNSRAFILRADDIEEWIQRFRYSPIAKRRTSL